MSRSVGQKPYRNYGKCPEKNCLYCAAGRQHAARKRTLESAEDILADDEEARLLEIEDTNWWYEQMVWDGHTCCKLCGRPCVVDGDDHNYTDGEVKQHLKLVEPK